MFAGILSAIVGFISTLVALRFVLRLLGANPANAFVNWVYDWSSPLVAPFAGIFGQDTAVVEGPGLVTPSVFDWTALIALVVYTVIGGLIIRLVSGK
jgi:hypothetical protein